MSQPNQSIQESMVSASVSTSQARSVSESERLAAKVETKKEPRAVSVERDDKSDKALQALGNVKLAITIDDSENLPVIKIFDSETGKELLQVPAEHSLHISKTIKAAVGAIFDKTV